MQHLGGVVIRVAGGKVFPLSRTPNPFMVRSCVIRLLGRNHLRMHTALLVVG